MEKTFSLKTYTSNKQISQPHFFILNKGLNSGRPSEKPNPNCFVLSTSSNADKEFYYWLLFGLWQSKAFHQYLYGSVIPFIRIGDLKSLIVQASEKAFANRDKFNNAISSLKQLDIMERKFQKNLLLIKHAKQLMFYNFGQ